MLPKSKMEELKTITNNAPQHVIVEGKGYLYFSLMPTQEEINLEKLLQDNSIQILSVRNFKNVVIGYKIQFLKKPKLLNIEEFGAAIFYTKTDSYKKPKVVYSDQKLRVISFDSKDYFISVKWKSNNPTE